VTKPVEMLAFVQLNDLIGLLLSLLY